MSVLRSKESFLGSYPLKQIYQVVYQSDRNYSFYDIYKVFENKFFTGAKYIIDSKGLKMPPKGVPECHKEHLST